MSKRTPARAKAATPAAPAPASEDLSAEPQGDDLLIVRSEVSAEMKGPWGFGSLKITSPNQGPVVWALTLLIVCMAVLGLGWGLGSVCQHVGLIGWQTASVIITTYGLLFLGGLFLLHRRK